MKTTGESGLTKLISLVKSALAAKAPTSHAVSATTYGKGTSSVYGHVKLSDSTTATTAAASGGTAATPKAVSDALAAAKSYADSVCGTPSKAVLLDMFYPVGTIYMSSNSTSPATLFGGTWVQLQDRFMIAAGPTYPAGTTGGSATHTHTTTGHTLTVNEMPSHNHVLFYPNSAGQGVANIGYPDATINKTWWAEACKTGNEGGGAAHSHGNTGSASNLPPYWAVCMWERTA